MRATRTLNIPDRSTLVRAKRGQKVFRFDDKYFSSIRSPATLAVRLIGGTDVIRHKADHDLLHNVRDKSVLFIPASTVKKDKIANPLWKNRIDSVKRWTHLGERIFEKIIWLRIDWLFRAEFYRSERINITMENDFAPIRILESISL